MPFANNDYITNENIFFLVVALFIHFFSLSLLVILFDCCRVDWFLLLCVCVWMKWNQNKNYFPIFKWNGLADVHIVSKWSECNEMESKWPFRSSYFNQTTTTTTNHGFFVRFGSEECNVVLYFVVSLYLFCFGSFYVSAEFLIISWHLDRNTWNNTTHASTKIINNNKKPNTHKRNKRNAPEISTLFRHILWATRL